jgi:hypothetical protein
MSIEPPISPTPPDLDREQVLAIFRQRDNEALKRHTAICGTDGAGTYYVLCGCELTFSLEDWSLHLRAVIKTVRGHYKR